MGRTVESYETVNRINAIADKLAAGCKLTNREMRWLLQWQLDVSGTAAGEMMHMLLRYKRTIWEYAKRN